MTQDGGALYAVSPLDGRYADRTEPFREYGSEAALMRARVEVEVEYLLALSDHDGIPVEIESSIESDLRDAYASFDESDAELVKRLEVEGARGYPATNHDVKAVEYFLREETPEWLHPWIHFGLTSEDVSNLAHRLLVRDAVEVVLLPALRAVRSELVSLAHEYAELPMLAHTHGQPASPTTFGKEMAVYASRLGRAMGNVDEAVGSLAGKFSGATGTFAAHQVGFPDVNWRAFARSFVSSLGLDYVPVATQINPGDDLARLFDALARLNRVLIDLDRDAWEYVSRRYLGQVPSEGETGSSTMPHKVNPIDFENSEGNLSKANSDLRFLTDSITTSRLQRDLSDSTVKRNIGGTLAYCLLGYVKLQDGLSAVVPNERILREDLRANSAVLAEAIQTVLRREGRADAYEAVKEATRGESVDIEDLQDLLDKLDLPESAVAFLRSLEPASYTGLAADLARDME